MNDSARRAPVTAVIISYNRAPLIAAVLRSVQFADEVILVDKSSTDGTPGIAAPFCDRVIQVPWSPTVEETRAEAVTWAKHDWVLLLDDDEILNPTAVAWIKQELVSPRAEVYGFHRREYMLGRHDPNAYYWPEKQVRLFLKQAVNFKLSVHEGFQLNTENIFWVDAESSVFVDHLSHPDVETWIAKTNRYTSIPYRRRDPTPNDLSSFAKESVDFWAARSKVQHPGDYPQAIALLRTTYDIIDRLKIWEKDNGLDGSDAFKKRAEELIAEHNTQDGGAAPLRNGAIENRVPADVQSHGAGESIEKLRSDLAGWRDLSMKQYTELQETKLARHELEKELAYLRDVQTRLVQVLGSTWWKIGEPLRRAGQRYPRITGALGKAARKVLRR